MDIRINANSGFCFGVVAAINKAEEVLVSGDKIYCLGQLVHNDAEMNRLESQGLITIDHNQLGSLKNVKVLLRAHGEPPSTYDLAKQNKNIIIDASCPIILKIQKRILKAYTHGETILIFGKHNHPETIGLKGHTNNEAIVFEEPAELNIDSLPQEVTLFSQTTMNLEKFRKAINLIEQSGRKVNVNDTICRQVTNREAELRKFCKEMDVVLMVAGKNSSNGKLLYNICHECTRAYFISSVDDISQDWFNQGEKVGVTGATSTPVWQMERVKEFLGKL
ncbi:MAG: 4-hydroxy-3-methylbut-2-enyl diphosphate reductase [Bacteroidales bacterium]|nr:4-hydroxy-3-methylbut-2-enyl diphosphate reductase [Bacteroidales bacterium]